jgi:UDP-glucose 4-epimerase
MKILITGANGYVGKSLYDALKNKYDVTAITRKDFDLTDINPMLKFFEDKFFDVVLHCASVGGSRLKQDDWDTMDTNLSIYYNLIQCKSKYGKLINFGSGAEVLAENTPYGFSKRVIRNSVINSENSFNIQIYAVFDENELDTRFIKANIKRYINKEPIQIYENKKMTFFYMKDLIKLVEHYIETDSNSLRKEVHCSYIGNYTLLEIAHFINGLDDHQVPILVGIGDGNDYFTEFNAGCGIEYIGLNNGIIEVYNSLR